MPTYVTADEVRTATQNAALDAENDATINALIESAEYYVDAMAGYWQKYDPDQALKFPRYQDVTTAGATFIPDRVKEATIAQVEFIYLQTPDVEHGIKDEDTPKVQRFSPRAKLLMRGFTKRTGQIIFPEAESYNPDRL